jgi:large subunit ribosomal protein L21
MYALVEIGSKQHRVSVGEKLLIDLKKDSKVGDQLEFNSVLLLGGDSYKVGKPYIDGAKVLCKVSNMGDDEERPGVKGDKVRVYKKKRRKGFDKTIGHRQRYTEVISENILA